MTTRGAAWEQGGDIPLDASGAHAGVTCQRCGAPTAPRALFCGPCTAAIQRTGLRIDRSAPAPGRTLPERYDIVRLLGQGAMGRVYLCRDRDLDVDIAIKILRSDLLQSPDAIARMRREAKAAAQFRGMEGFLSVYTFGVHEGLGYVVMEYAPGGSLQSLVRSARRLPEAECRRIGAEVARALAHAHRRDLVHRDVKPANVLLDARNRAKLADFGIAKVLVQTVTTQTSEAFVGTPAYMAPEVLEGLPVDGRADLYSLGCMLYEMATGELPFQGAFTEIVIAKTRPDAVTPDPRRVLPTLSADFADIVRRLLERHPERRAADGMRYAMILHPPTTSLALAPMKGARTEKRDALLASALFRKGERCQAEGHYDRAARFLERALEIDTRLFGDSDAVVARDLKYIARNWYLQRRYDQAEAPFVRALDILRQTRGRNHPEVAHNLMFLGRLLTLQGRHADAAAAYDQALHAVQKSGSRQGAVLARILNHLAAAEMAAGRPERARPVLDQCLAAVEKRKGCSHPGLSPVLNTYARLHLLMGDYRGCHAVLNRALSILTRAYGNEHPSMVPSLDLYAQLLERLGRKRDAQAKRREAERIRRGSSRPSSPWA